MNKILYVFLLCTFLITISGCGQKSLMDNTQKLIKEPQSNEQATKEVVATITSHRDNQLGISFTHPARWKNFESHYYDQQINFNDPALGLPKLTKQIKERIIHAGGSVYFYDSVDKNFICKNGGCGIYISVIEYDNKHDIVLNCYESSCDINESILLEKNNIKQRSNFYVADFPALLKDEYSFLGIPYRQITFFTPNKKITLSFNIQSDDIATITDLSKPFEKKIDLEKLIAESKNTKEFSSALQEFMNLVDSFKIE